jgi:uncharacterized repeat protein (TIGR02543 family)
MAGVALAALVSAAALGALVFSCTQLADEPLSLPVSAGVFTLNGADGGAYTVRVYPYAGGSTDTHDAWIEATADAKLAAEGEAEAEDGTALVSLSKPGGGTFTASRTHIAVVTGEADGETRFTTAVFRNGSASANWNALKTPPAPEEEEEEGFFTIIIGETGIYRLPDTRAGTTERPSMSVVIRNTGTAASVPLTVTVDEGSTFDEGASAFIIENANITGIEAGGSASFTVRPVSGLPVGTYTALVSVRSGLSAPDAVFGSVTVAYSVVEDAPSRGIDLSKSGFYTFPIAAEGYDAAAELSVKVYNSGTEAANRLYAFLSGSNPEVFRLAPKDLGPLEAGGSAAFTVAAIKGLQAGTYTAKVTVGGSTGTATLETKSFTVGFTVIPADGRPVYGIDLSEADAYDFPSRVEGYADIPPVLVSVVNTGNMPTGPLSVSIDGPFSTDKTFLESIPAGGSAFFSVALESGLAPGDYSGTLTVESADGGTGIAAKSVAVRFTSVTRDVGIDITPSEPYRFPTLGGWPAPLEVSVRNSGNKPTGTLQLTLEGANAGSYELSADSLPPLETGVSAVFTVSPATGLAAGSTHTAALRVSSVDVEGIEDRTLALSFTVPQYAVALSSTGVYLFPETEQGLAVPAPLQVAVKNTGNNPTGPLAVTVTPDSGTDSGDFVLAGLIDDIIDSMAVGGSDAFTIVPRTGLSGGSGSVTYAATVTLFSVSDTSISDTSISDTSVPDANAVSASFRVSFTVLVGRTVRFDANGGSTVSGQHVLHGKYAGEPAPVPAKNKLRLKGWYTGNGTRFNFTATPIVADITLYARWEADVTFNTNGAGSSRPSQVVDEGAYAAAPADPTAPAGWFFEYWYLYAENTPYNFTDAVVMGHTQLTAKWSYTVSFNANGGTGGPPDQRVLSNRFAAKPPASDNPTRANFFFRDWYKTASADTAAFNFAGEAVTAPLVLYAGWAPAYTVTLNKDGGSWSEDGGQDTHSVPAGSVFTPSRNITKQGYSLAGWCTDAAKTNTVTSITVTAAVTLYAKWTPNTYTITMNKNGGHWEGAPGTYLANHGGPLPAVIGQDTYSAAYDSVFTIPDAPITRDGYAFQGWYSDSQMTNKVTGVTVTGNMTIYARWQSMPNVQVKFHAGDPGNYMTQWYTNGIAYGGRTPTIFYMKHPSSGNWRFQYWRYSNGSRFYWGHRLYGDTNLYGVYKWDWNPGNRDDPYGGWDAIY